MRNPVDAIRVPATPKREVGELDVAGFLVHNGGHVAAHAGPPSRAFLLDRGEADLAALGVEGARDFDAGRGRPDLHPHEDRAGRGRSRPEGRWLTATLAKTYGGGRAAELALALAFAGRRLRSRGRAEAGRIVPSTPPRAPPPLPHDDDRGGRALTPRARSCWARGSPAPAAATSTRRTWWRPSARNAQALEGGPGPLAEGPGVALNDGAQAELVGNHSGPHSIT